jgi:predicted TIM-barrel fold metal-dependent hydrolase
VRQPALLAPPPSFIDAHLHLWDLDRYRYPWLDAPEFAPIRSSYTAADWHADAAGLDVLGTVHVQAELDHCLDPVLETEWLSQVRSASAGSLQVPTVAVPYADLADAGLDQVLDRHLTYPFVRGIRHEAWYDPATSRADIASANHLDDPEWRAGLRRVAARRLVFDLLVWHHQLPQATGIFTDLPELPLVLEHTGIPRADDREQLHAWRRELRSFARRVPQARLKISAMNFIARPWTRAGIEPIIREAIDIFGPSRCMLASNFPVERPTTSYVRLWQEYDAITADLSAAERTALFSGTARSFYRIG